MDELDPNQPRTVSFHHVRRSTSILVLNCADNRLIAAGQQNFQLFSIDENDQTVQLNEQCDFRNTLRLPPTLRPALQPKDVGWSQQDERCFATASSTTGDLYVWDATRLEISNQFLSRQPIINRVQFHPKSPHILLIATQDGYAKLLDVRASGNDRIATVFRHTSKEAFRDIDINPLNTDKFATVINDQYSVPIWDFRQPTQPEFSVLTRDKVLCVAWNPHERSWLATGGIGMNRRAIRVWDAKGSDSRQQPLFTVYTFGQVTKFSWRPACRYHITSFASKADRRIHVWDIRRAYMPTGSFCHHRSDIGDFVWRHNSDNLISVDRDETLVHAPYSSAVKSDQLAPVFSMHTTSKGSVLVAQPNIDNEYVRALHKEQIIPSSTVSLSKSYSPDTIEKFVKWDRAIDGRTVLGIFNSPAQDDPVRVFHQFAHGWKFGNGTSSLEDLENVCDVNSAVAEHLKRTDLRATWQVIKMLYTDRSQWKRGRARSSKMSRSLTRALRLSDSTGAAGQHHHRHQAGRTVAGIDEQLEDPFSNEHGSDENKFQSQDQRLLLDCKLAMIDELDSYIIRDTLPDDILFISQEDILDSGNGMDVPYDSQSDIEAFRDALTLPVTAQGTPSNDIDINEYLMNRLSRRISGFGTIEDDPLKEDDDYEDSDDNMQTSGHSMVLDGSENFFTIDENYCPTAHEHAFDFDPIIRETLWYYIENNELQMVVHLLLALYPHMTEKKRVELFNGAHMQWIVMYIELLQKMRLFVKAKTVTKHCLENEGIPLHYNPAAFDGTIIFAQQTATVTRSSSLAAPLAPVVHNSAAAVLKDFVCSICRIPCRSLLSFCGVCFHGGHMQHIDAWFRTHDECPYGCGHRCRDLVSQNARTRPVQRLTSKTSFTAQH